MPEYDHRAHQMEKSLVHHQESFMSDEQSAEVDPLN